jgi:nucleotide-binding universal stress UspA family protein
MPNTRDRPVLAGVNGSVESLAAVGLAATEAALRRVPLVVTHAWAGPPWWPGRGRSATPRTDAERLLAVATGWLRRHYPGVPVTGRLVLGDPVDVLADAAESAQLVVVGHGGAGLTSLSPGAVSTRLSRRNRTPLIVRTFRPDVRAPAPDAPVLVAASADPSGHTLRFAFAEAARYGVPLVPWLVGPIDRDREHDRARRALDAALARWSARYPDVRVCPRERPGEEAARALAQDAAMARLLVVGAGPDRALTDLVRGSLASPVLRAATCPVAVVPEHVPAAQDQRSRRIGAGRAG